MAIEDHADRLRVIGVDPGPVPGLLVLDLEAGQLLGSFAYQCTANGAPWLLEALLLGQHAALIQVEKFVVGKKAGRVAHAGASATTRDLVGQLQNVVDRVNAPATFVLRPAAAVKPWASEERLAKARLLEPTKGMRHARDAARHALFAAVQDGGLPDPLSKQFQTKEIR